MLRSSEDVTGKLDGKIYSFREYWSIKIIVFMDPKIIEKKNIIFALDF